MREAQFFSGHDLLKLESEPNKFIIDGFLWERDTVMLLGDAKCGKSLLSLQMACNLSCGSPFLNEYEIPRPYRVLYIQTEGKYAETRERLMSMLPGLDWDPSNFMLYYHSSASLNTTIGFETFMASLIKHQLQPEVIFLDPLYMAMEGDLSDNVASRVMVRNLRQMSDQFGATFVLIHHEHAMKRNLKGDALDEGDRAIMGSFVWRAFPDHVIHLRKRNDGLRTVSCSTQRGNRVVEEMRLELISEPLQFKIHGTVGAPNYVAEVLKHFEQEKTCTAKQVEEGTKLSRSAVMKSLATLLKAKKLEKLNVGCRPVFYGLCEATKRDANCV